MEGQEQALYRMGVISLNEVLLSMGQETVPGGWNATIGTQREAIEPYTPHPEYEQMLFADAEWKPEARGGYMQITYTASHIDFTCATCGTQCHLVKHSEHTVLSATFCLHCGEQYYTRWDGVLCRGKIVSEESEQALDA